MKIEDKYALENVEETLKIPGSIAFAEWGPGDMAVSSILGVRAAGPLVKDPRMQAARARVFAACKANKIFFLNSFAANDVVDMIKEGVKVGPESQETAEIGRNGLSNAKCRGNHAAVVVIAARP